MKTIFTILLTLVSILGQTNSLLTNPQIGQPFPTETSNSISEIALVSDGSDVALIIANNTTRSLYAIDINDNNPADAAANTITQIPNFKAEIEAAIGVTNITIENFEVNPISKSVYVLTYDGTGKRYIVVVKNNGASITSLNLTNINYVAITFNTSNNPYYVHDMCWGNNTLYVSSGGYWLDNFVGTITAPFSHNSSTMNNATSMFKSNMGGGYWTGAPLEKFDFITINNENRLAGVTTCAPGFSLLTDSITGSGILQVQEHFSLNGAPPAKTIAMEQNDTSYLFHLHRGANNILVRIGEKYIDGSRIAANQYNDNRVSLRDNNGFRPASLTDADIIIYNETFHMIAYYTAYQILVLDTNDVLRLFTTGSPSTTNIKLGKNEPKITVYPNPANEWISIRYPDNLPVNSKVIIYTLDGKEVYDEPLPAKDQLIFVTSLKNGAYLVCILTDKQKIFQAQLIVN